MRNPAAEYHGPGPGRRATRRAAVRPGRRTLDRPGSSRPPTSGAYRTPMSGPSSRISSRTLARTPTQRRRPTRAPIRGESRRSGASGPPAGRLPRSSALVAEFRTAFPLGAARRSLGNRTRNAPPRAPASGMAPQRIRTSRRARIPIQALSPALKQPCPGRKSAGASAAAGQPDGACYVPAGQPNQAPSAASSSSVPRPESAEKT